MDPRPAAAPVAPVVRALGTRGMATPTTEPAPPAGEAAGKPEAAAKAGGEAPAAGGAEAPAPGGKGGKASPFAATSLYVSDDPAAPGRRPRDSKEAHRLTETSFPATKGTWGTWT